MGTSRKAPGKLFIMVFFTNLLSQTGWNRDRLSPFLGRFPSNTPWAPQGYFQYHFHHFFPQFSQRPRTFGVFFSSKFKRFQQIFSPIGPEQPLDAMGDPKRRRPPSPDGFHPKNPLKNFNMPLLLFSHFHLFFFPSLHLIMNITTCLPHFWG